ncbi:DUF4974 domain-containing protein [Flavobacteriaceae bacterium TP-CH-4]|uniref:DUF4974 domain-containing protein n=1 Tax=Pelagihabitans pacificus TaxID=2696054 RepID=A0A967AWA0_9FLAO|nr:FecR family protein [Pelagihabitans pacificus]NHF58752.1 DUF4974 domain-containing protein [Pelagihabitans pacificus]
MHPNQLIRKKLLEDLRPEEQRQLDLWLSESEENMRLYHRLLDLQKRNIVIPNFDRSEPTLVWQKLLREQENRKQKKIQYQRMAFRFAAVFAGLASILWVIWIQNRSEGDRQRTTSEITLQLSNDYSQTIRIGGEEPIFDQNERLMGIKRYDVLNYGHYQTDDESVYHSLWVPNGKQFAIQLPDGTQIRLNSGSSIRYPVNQGHETVREVALTGEAYFKVSKNKKRPFVVSSGEVSIQVMGTEFNVTAYEDDFQVNTVLVEGSISLYGGGGKALATPIRLVPGQKATWNKSNNELKTKNVDVEHYTSWREGKLVFRKTSFEAILRRLQRKYNVKIENRFEALRHRIFSATFDKETISEVLDTFAEETYFEYRLEDKKIVIEKPREHLKMNAYD